jgi:hypothetical protein
MIRPRASATVCRQLRRIKQDLAWRSVTGVPMSRIVITRQQAQELVAEIERLQACTHIACRKTCADCDERLGAFLPPSPPAEKATAR